MAVTMDTLLADAETFHAGESAMQASVGVAARMAEIGPAVIRDRMPEQHQQFFPLLPFLIVGSVDAVGHPAASVLAGPAGFVTAPDARTLHVAATPDLHDPLHEALAVGAPLGVLGIQPHTRRRNRANGVVRDHDGHGFTIAITQSFGNCPKYIQAREPRYLPRAGATEADAEAQHFDGLPARARMMLQQADTFFIATAHPDARAGKARNRAHGVDVSHRGGRPGFVHVDDDDMLTVPDYSGNRFFNTLGNLLLSPHAGLLLMDYDSGDVLQLAVRGEIVTDRNQVIRFAGAERLIRFTVDHSLLQPKALPLMWGPATLSPILENLTR